MKETWYPSEHLLLGDRSLRSRRWRRRSLQDLLRREDDDSRVLLKVLDVEGEDLSDAVYQHRGDKSSIVGILPEHLVVRDQA